MKSRKTFPERPRRLSFIHQKYFTPLYFVTFCTYRRRRFLATENVFAAFRDFAIASSKRRIAIGRFVIMPDHVHLLVRGFLEFRLGPWVASFKQTLAKAGGDARSAGRIWQEGFFDHVLRNERSYGRKWEYVRQNPVRAGLVSTPDEWRYQGEMVRIERNV